MLKDDDQARCTDPDELRRRAKDARGRLALIKLEAMNLDREADQLEHEARLWDASDAADAVWEGLRQKTAGLEAAAEGTLAARRQAEDRLREDRKHVARRKGEVTRAEHGASRDAQDEAAVRLHKSEQRVAETERELAAAAGQHQGAEKALEAHRAQLREAQDASTRAMEAGFNPGIAPRTSPLQIGLGRPEDMTVSERGLLGLVIGAAVQSGGSKPDSQVPAREWHTTKGGFVGQDPAKFRVMQQGNRVIAVPPAPGR